MSVRIFLFFNSTSNFLCIKKNAKKEKKSRMHGLHLKQLKLQFLIDWHAVI